MMNSTAARNESRSSMEDREELLSSTDVDESSIGDENFEKQWLASELQTEKRLKENRLKIALRLCRWLVDAFLLLVIVLLLVLLRERSTERPSQVGGDFTGASPTFSTQIVKFESDMSYTPKNMSEFFSEGTLATWNKMMPVGSGHGSTSEPFYTTSMTHQLHCVYMMARIYSGVATNNTRAIPDDYDSHFLHCIDYLRQSVMCSADLALEAHDALDPDDLGPLDGGWSGQHVCKNYNQVIGYLERQIYEGKRVVLAIDD